MTVGRTTLLLAPIALIARTVAFFVPVVVARVYGVVPQTDAFFWALSVPTFLLVLATMAVGTVLVPPLARLRAAAPEHVPVFLGASMVYAGAASLVFGALFALAAPAVLVYTSAFDEPTRALAVRACWELLPLLAGVALSAVARTACEVHGQFKVSVAGPLIRAAVVIVLLFVARPLGPSALTLAFSAGTLAEMLLLVLTLRAMGVHVAPSLQAPPELRAAAASVAPVLTGEAMVALNLVVDKAFAANLGEGAVSLLEYADRAQMIPRTVLEGTLVTVAFNAWASARAAGDVEGQRTAVSRALLWLLLLAPPVLAGMSVGRVALVKVLYGGGRFTPEHVSATAAALDAFLPGVLFSLLGALIVKAHILDGRLRLVLVLGAASFSLNAALDLVLLRFGLAGLATATSITTIVITVVSLSMLLPTLRGTVPARETSWALTLAGTSALLAGAARGAGFAPDTVLDPLLWAASVPCFALLAAGAWRARRLP